MDLVTKPLLSLKTLCVKHLHTQSFPSRWCQHKLSGEATQIHLISEDPGKGKKFIIKEMESQGTPHLPFTPHMHTWTVTVRSSWDLEAVRPWARSSHHWLHFLVGLQHVCVLLTMRCLEFMWQITLQLLYFCGVNLAESVGTFSWWFTFSWTKLLVGHINVCCKCRRCCYNGKGFIFFIFVSFIFTAAVNSSSLMDWNTIYMKHQQMMFQIIFIGLSVEF